MDVEALLRKRSSEVSIEVFDPDHYHLLVKAIQNILSTELAELSIAQLIDGVPLMMWVFEGRDVYSRKATHCLNTRIFIMQAYQISEIGSGEFKMRLVELTAVAVHNLAVLVYQGHPKFHSQEEIDKTVSCTVPPRWIEDDGLKLHWEKVIEPHPTLFYRIDYLDHDRYTHGLADVVGYWAEDRNFGGVVLFEKGDYPELQEAFDELTNYESEESFVVTLEYDERGLPIVTKSPRDPGASEDNMSQASSGKRRKLEDGSGKIPPAPSELLLVSPPSLGSPPPLDSPPPLSSPRLCSAEPLELSSSPDAREAPGSESVSLHDKDATANVDIESKE
ncbi:hypothetical protein QC764_507860 [Podospora pseudoanserina]|uniref:HORMA domain-containing protein n=1 Tax=Podospora pseudoanserina TaxID=2609844 RepID=A0ABR0I733_9PEZI|nr:hypothetical protein QC764_507860 [Podospora pseudoanserina]